MVKQLCAVGLSPAPTEPWISTALSEQFLGDTARSLGWTNPLWAWPRIPVGLCLGWTTAPGTSPPATPPPSLSWAGSSLLPAWLSCGSLPCQRGGLQPPAPNCWGHLCAATGYSGRLGSCWKVAPRAGQLSPSPGPGCSWGVGSAWEHGIIPTWRSREENGGNDKAFQASCGEPPSST